MTPQERDVIAGIFDRLKAAQNQPREAEAERFIADKVREQPYAPYAMAQAIYVQEQALANLQQQLEQTQAQLREAEERPQQPSGGFLSGLFGGSPQPQSARPAPSSFQQGGQPDAPSGPWNRQAVAPGGPGGQQGQPSPWANQGGQQPQAMQAAQQGRGSGFLGSALTTAAGVAGGMVVGNMLMNAFKGDGTAQAAQTAGGAQPAADTSQANADQGYNDGSSDAANYQNAGYEQPADQPYDDGSSFMDDGGGDDWA